jgi:hypothetical protein
VDKEDNVNYYKSTYPSFSADDENRRNFEFAMDNGDMQHVQVIAIPLAAGNNFDTNIAKSLASYIQQASKSQHVLQEENEAQQVMTGGNDYHVGSYGFKKELMNTGEIPELNKYKFGKPSNDGIGYIDTEHLNELNTNMNTQTYSYLLSDTSTNPSLQYGLLRSSNAQENYRPHDNKELLSQKLDERGNSPPEEHIYSKPTLPRNDLYTDKNFPQQTTYNRHQYANAQTMDSDMYKNKHKNIYSKHEEESEYQDIYKTYTRCSQVNPGLTHNITPVSDYELPPIGRSSEHNLKKPTGTREDITYNKVINNMLLYPSSDNRRLMQGKFVYQNGFTSSPYVQGNPGLNHNTVTITNSELPPVGHSSEYTLNKPTGTSEDITHNKEVSDILFYSSSDNRRLMQSKFVPPIGLTSSPYVQEPQSNMLSYYSGKPSAVLQEDGLLVETIPNAQQKAGLQVQNMPDTWREDGLLVQSLQDAEQEDGLLVQSIPNAQQKARLQVQNIPDAWPEDGLLVHSLQDGEQEDGLLAQSIPNAQQKAGLQVQNIPDAWREDGLLVQNIPDVWREDGSLVQSASNAQQKGELQVQNIPDAWGEDGLLVHSLQDAEQEDGLLVQGIPDAQQEDSSLVQNTPNARAKEASACYKEIPHLSSHVFKFLTSQDGMWKKDSRLTTENSMIPLPTANTIPSMSHIPYHYRDLKEVLNNMDSPKLNIIASKYDDSAASPYFIQKNKILSHHLPYIKEINELNGGLQFTQDTEDTPPLPYIKEIKERNEGLHFMQNGDNTPPHNCKASTITNVPKRPELMTDHSKYTQWVANISPNRDETPRYLSRIDGRYTVPTNLPFQIPTYNFIESDDNLPSAQKPVTPQYDQMISTSPINMNVESVALQSQSPTSITQSQLAHHKPTNYRLTEGTNNMKFSISEEDKCGASTVISEVNDKSKCTPSTVIPSQNGDRSKILWVPEEMRTASSSVNDNSYFVSTSDSSEVQASLKPSTVSGRTKNKFSHTFQNTTNDSHYLPASVITSLEHAHLSPTPSSSINVQARSKSEDTFRQTVNTPVHQYPAELKESLMETYSAVTFPPLVTTVTMGTYLPETYTEMPIMDDYKNKTIMRHDITPTLQLNGNYERAHYSVTKVITSEENMNDVSNSTRELLHGFKQKSSDETTDFSELFQYDINTATAEKEMKEKWNAESEQSTSIMPNLYEVYKIQDDTHPTTNAMTMGAITDDATEQTATDLLNHKFKIQLGPTPGNTMYQPIMRAKVTQQQDTYYNPGTTMTELLTEKPYNYVSDVAYITYVTPRRQDDHSSMASTVASNDKETKAEGLALTDKRASSEDEGNYYLSTTTALLPENTTNITYMNTQPPESTEPTHKESLNEFYTTTVTPQPTEVQEATEKRMKITDTAVSKKEIRYKEKVSTYLKADKPIITTNAGHSRKQVIFESGMDKVHKTTTDKFPHNYREQINAQRDTQTTLKMKTTEKYTSPGTLTPKTTTAQETYQIALHIPNKTNIHESTVSDKTTFQTIAVTSDITNGMSEKSFPTERSDISQTIYFKTPYESEADDRNTADLHIPNNANSLIPKDGLQYLHTEKYGTSQSAIFTKTPYANYNEDKMRSTLNVAVGGWNQKDAQDVAIDQDRAYFDDRDMLQQLTTTSEGSDDLDTLYFIIPTLPPQQNMVTNNYIQLRDAKLEKNTEWFPELQNKQEKQGKTGITSSLPKVQNDTEEQNLVPHHAAFRSENINADVLCNDTASSQSRNMAEYLQNDRSGIVKQFSYDDTKGVSSEHIQLRNSITDSMEVLRPDNAGDILSEYKIPEDITKIVTDNELPGNTTQNSTEYKQTDITGVYTENTQSGGQHTQYKYLEKEPAGLIKYQQPEKMTAATQGYKVDDPLRVVAGHKHPKYEPPTQYGTDNQGVLQFQVVTEQTGITQGELKRTDYTENYNTKAVKQSDEDVTNETNDLKNALVHLLQNNDKIKLLLESPNSDTTSAPPTPTEIDRQSHWSKEPDKEDQEQTQALKLAFSKLTPANLVYNSVETSNVDRELLKNVIMDTIKSKDFPPESLPEKKRQTKSSQDIHTATSEKCKIIHISKGKHDLKYQDKPQQPSISKKEYSSAFQVPSLQADKSENTYQINTKPKQNFKLKAGVVRSNDISDATISLAHLPQTSDMRTQRSTCGPWTWYKNYFFMPAVSPELNDHLVLSDNEHINTVPTSIYEMNINREPEYDYEMDSSLQSDKTAQDLVLNFRNQQPNINTNFQHSDTLSEEKIMMKNIIHNINEENQSLYDDSMTDIDHMLDSPQLLRFHVYKDKTGLQPKLHIKRMSNLYHNIQNIPEENYQQVIQNSIVASRPVFLENWKKYQRLLEEIIQPNPSACDIQNCNNPHIKHLSHVNNNEANAKALLVFKKGEVNQEPHDDNNEQITYSKSGRKNCHQPAEQEILKQELVSLHPLVRHTMSPKTIQSMKTTVKN